MLRRHELTDAQWNAIKDLIPGKQGDPGRTGQDNRLFVNAVIYVARTDQGSSRRQRFPATGRGKKEDADCRREPYGAFAIEFQLSHPPRLIPTPD